MDITISSSGFEEIRRKFGLIISSKMKSDIIYGIGVNVSEKIKDHLDKMSVSRHKTADRLGAEHTRYFEFASGRLGGVREDGSSPGVNITKQIESGVTVSVMNTPGLLRAFGPVTITPKKAKALTIPINRISYGKSVANLKSEGRKIFRITGKKGKAMLAESDGGNGLRPLYLLVKKTVLPEDKGLLPSEKNMNDWTLNAIKGTMRAMTL